MVNSLDGLGHDAVVGSDHQDNDVGDLRATGAHGGKRLMARGVDERDLAAVDHDLGSTDVLGDAAGLAAPNVGVTDGVEQAGLAVVDVAHDGDHGRTGLEVLGIVVEAEGVLLLGGDDANLAAHVVGDELNQVIAHGLRHGKRGAQQEQALDDVVSGNVEGLGELCHGDALGNFDGVEILRVDALGDSLFELLLLLQLLRLALALLLALLAATGRLAGRLLDGGSSLLEDLLAAVLFRLASHAGVTVFLNVSGTLALLTLTTLIRGREVDVAGNSGGSVAAATMSGRLVRRGTAITAITAIGTLAALAALATALARGSLGSGSSLLLRVLFLLLLQDGFLSRDLIKQGAEAGAGIRCRNSTTLGLELLGGDALLLLAGSLAGSLLGCGAGGLLGGLGCEGESTLLLATGLGGDALLLGLRLSSGLLGCSSLLLGNLLRLDLSRTGLDHRGELLLHHGDVCVFECRRSGLRRDLHFCELVEQLLGSHSKFFSKA